MADSIPSVTISEFNFRNATRNPMKAPSASVMANIVGMASVGPIVSCRSRTTMVEKDIIDPTERSRLPLITTKVTPSAITPRIADERTTPMILSGSMKRGFAMVNPMINSAKATRMQ